MLSTELLIRLSADAQGRYRKAGDNAERKKWQSFLLKVDAELGARKLKQEAPRGRSGVRKAPDDRPLAERLRDSEEALYGVPGRGEAAREAKRLRPQMEQAHRKMGGKLPDDPEAVRERAQKVMQDMTGGKA